MRRLLALRCVVAALVTVALLSPPVAAGAAPQGEAVDGGAAPTQATAIEAGTAYSDDIRPGEARWSSLDVDEGQELGTTLTEYGAAKYNCCLKVELSDPDFDSIRSDLGSNTTGTAQTLRAETDEDGVAESGTYSLSVELDSGTSPLLWGVVGVLALLLLVLLGLVAVLLKRLGGSRP